MHGRQFWSNVMRELVLLVHRIDKWAEFRVGELAHLLLEHLLLLS